MTSRLSSYIYGDEKHRVTAAGVVVYRIDGPEVYLMQGAVLPRDASPAHVEHLVNLGLVRPFTERKDDS